MEKGCMMHGFNIQVGSGFCLFGHWDKLCPSLIAMTLLCSHVGDAIRYLLKSLMLWDHHAMQEQKLEKQPFFLRPTCAWCNANGDKWGCLCSLATPPCQKPCP
ncbi:hypothetical protein V6N13_016325 [Hibiscus sabdariffa]|uniref:Uncharacterized protein n=2 Tax=Hibiscus sabdariffa TaxID=183260 RepID=A0ABR1ZZ88_9ROSI